jgi:hypothetical protein
MSLALTTRLGPYEIVGRAATSDVGELKALLPSVSTTRMG